MKTISVQEAKTLWQEALAKWERKQVRRTLEDLRGQVLAEDVLAPQAIPAFNKSAMDGYALIYEEGRKDYEVVGLIGAGMVWTKPLEKGQAVRIMTGAPLPESCDTIVMQEAVQGAGTPGSRVTIKGTVKKGQHIIRKGEECQEGDLLLSKGLVIDGTVQSVLAGLGRTEVAVYQPLKALLLTSGREVVEPGQNLGAGQIYNSNRFLLEGLLREVGVEAIHHHHISDNPDLLEEETQRVLTLAEDVDLILSSGGVSVGLFDTMPHIYEALGAQVIYERIAMRPGAASYGAVTPKGILIFGLSGNPVAAYNGFHLLAKPAIALARGLRDSQQVLIRCQADCDFTKKNPLDRYVQGRVYEEQGSLRFTLADSQSSSAMVALAKVNALAYIPQGTEGVKKGDFIHILGTKSL